MNRTFLALALLPLGVVSAGAQPIVESSSIASCVALVDDTDRLACYDRLFRISSASAAITINSEQTILARPSGRANATFSLVCEGQAPRLEFAFAGNPLSSTRSNVGISVKRDLRSSRALSLPASPDGTTAVMMNRADVEAFVQSLQGIASLTLETRTTDYRSVAVRFQVADHVDDLTAALAACR